MGEYNDWEWAFIAICLGSNSPDEPDFPEVVRCSIKNRVLEFRLYMDYTSFLESDYGRRVGMYFSALERCWRYPQLKKWKFPESYIDSIIKIIEEAKQNIL